MNKAFKSWLRTCLICLTLMLFIGAGFVAWIDPYFHYHKALPFLSYWLGNQRYQNYGIAKNFDYDAIITGTSMTENFKSSQLDKLFGTHSVKTSFSGAGYREVKEYLDFAAKHNKKLRMVVRSLDYFSMLLEADYLTYPEGDYPRYLYDENPVNDVKYLLNKSVLVDAFENVILFGRAGNETTSFDDYSYWAQHYTFGKESLLKTYQRPGKSGLRPALSQEERSRIQKTISKNILYLANKYPQIDFYIFFPPYSIYYFDSISQSGELLRFFEIEKLYIEGMIGCENIHLFSFLNEFEMICNADNYKDITHYSPEINEKILEWMKEGKHRLTKENYEEYCEKVKKFYTGYDYDALF